LWNVTLICLLDARLPGADQRRLFARLDRAVLFRHARRLIVLRYLIVRVTALARAAGLISAQRIFLIGTGAHIGAFVHHYEPWTLGLNIVGCRFLTPLPPAHRRNAARRSIATSPKRSPACAASSPTRSIC
jgi:hypothetical protein